MSDQGFSWKSPENGWKCVSEQVSAHQGLVNSSMGLEGQHVTSCTSSANAASRPLGSIWYRYMSLTSDSAVTLQAQSRLAVSVHKSSDAFAHI